MPPAAPPTPAEIKDANARYHDLAAADYDAKWGIDFGAVGQQQVRAKIAKALGHEPDRPFPDALEIGAGTGYFSLNLLQLGWVQRATVTDISQGMLDALAESARALGVEVDRVCSDAEELPFADASFDLVFGHAVLHHIPDLDRAAAELLRVLRPGGALAFCGEPSLHGDRIAALPKRGGALIAPLWRRLVGAGRRDYGPSAEVRLEFEVDVHAFDAASLRSTLERAGFAEVRIRGEELLANAYGWLLRSLEATAKPDQVPIGWREFAFRSYMTLQRIDTRVLEPRLPPEIFYNLVLSATKPA